tara:strand:- start:12566 stop:13090 length:525 start_codon:yes stop_codon:yes gene_type:complete
MNENKTIIDKVKLLLSEEVIVKEDEVVEAKFLTVSTEDGQSIEVEGDVLEVGAVVVGITEDTSLTLEDGTVVVVSAEGLITEINEAVAEEEETVEEEMAEEVVEEDPNNARIDSLETKLDELLSKFSAIKEIVSLIADEPAEEEIKVDKKEFAKTKKDDLLKSFGSYKSKNLQP